MRRRSAIVEKIEHSESLSRDVSDAIELLELAAAENDESTITEVGATVPPLTQRVRWAELRRMLSGPQITRARSSAFTPARAGPSRRTGPRC